MKLIHKLEPLWWMLFGAGGFLAAFFLPGLLIGVGILAPLGMIEDGLAYERALRLASSGVGKVLLVVVLSLTLWHCAHHLRHLGLDLGMKPALPAYASYLIATAGTVATLVLVAGL